jgi:hypothetical protein
MVDLVFSQGKGQRSPGVLSAAGGSGQVDRANQIVRQSSWLFAKECAAGW